MLKRSKGEPMEIVNQTKLELRPEESFWWMKFIPQQNTWTNVNIFRFLRLYKTYPVLWDPKNPKYSKSSERFRAFTEISKKLKLQGIHENECMKLVDSLRVIYIEEKHKKEEAESCIHRYKPPPVWFQVLNDIVESVMNNEKEKSSSDSKIDNEQLTESINCRLKYRTDNIWTPTYFKTDLWRLFAPKTMSYITEEEKQNEKDHKSEHDKGFHVRSKIDSCKTLKESIDAKQKYCLQYKNILRDCSSHSKQNLKKYCPEFENIVCNCSSHSFQNKKKYCPELKNVVCDCSSHSMQNIKKYCPEFKNILCDCSSQSSQRLKMYCPECKNILCHCSSHSSQNINKYCPEFENLLCDCPSDTKYYPDNKNALRDCSLTISSDSKITKDSDCKLLINNVVAPSNFTILTPHKKKYGYPFMDELDRYCYYKDWNKYYKCKICDSKENFKESFQPEKEFYAPICNQKPARPHKNNMLLETDMNLFLDLKPYYQFQLYDCMEYEPKTQNFKGKIYSVAN